MCTRVARATAPPAGLAGAAGAEDDSLETCGCDAVRLSLSLVLQQGNLGKTANGYLKKAPKIMSWWLSIQMAPVHLWVIVGLLEIGQ